MKKSELNQTFKTKNLYRNIQQTRSQILQEPEHPENMFDGKTVCNVSDHATSEINAGRNGTVQIEEMKSSEESYDESGSEILKKTGEESD